jgi:VIT1/CCC1 family predicted Fe2+/Mn2+ transporter
MHLLSGDRFELGLEKPDPGRALQSALTIAASYIVGGMIPLLPYMFYSKALNALKISCVVTLIALLIFGFVKGKFTGSRPFLSAIQTAVIGALASAAAFGIAKAINPS